MSLPFDHIWQSTAVLAVIGLLTLFFRNNGAHVRHVLWTVASLKFLVPFALLKGLGVLLASLFGLKLSSLAMFEVLSSAGQPFADGSVLPEQGGAIWLLVLGGWFAGTLVLLGFWFSRWRMLRTALHSARDAAIAAPMPVRISPLQREPGLVGIFRPVLLLPEGIAGNFTGDELAAVIAHEACHLRRRDNLLAALHMLVQALFWFWPPVWWLGARLIDERERACDEAVLAAGNAPQVYAASILKVCKFYVQSPLACAAGVAGADLNRRMETIMEDRMVVRVGGVKKSLLGAAVAALVLTPVAAGLLWSPVARAQGQACRPEPVMQTHTLPPYPIDSAALGETGTVELLVTVGRDGRASSAMLTRNSGFARLDDAATSFVRERWLWRPSACAPAQVPVRVVFNLMADKPAIPPANR